MIDILFLIGFWILIFSLAVLFGNELKRRN